MPVTKVLARDWTLKVKNPDTSLFVEVKGLESLGFSGDATRTPTTDFDSGGNAEHILAERSRTLSIEGHYMEDEATGDRDPGQELIDTAAELVGNAALREFQLDSPGGNRREFHGTVTPADLGGGTNDTADWGAEIEVSGEVDIKKAPNGVVELTKPVEDDDANVTATTSGYVNVSDGTGYLVLTNVTTDVELDTDDLVAEGVHTLGTDISAQINAGDLLLVELFDDNTATKLLGTDSTIVQPAGA